MTPQTAERQASAVVSYGCHNKVAPTGCLRTIEIYCLTVLEATSQKARCLLPLTAPSSPCLMVASSPWHSLAGNFTPAVSVSAFSQPLPCGSVSLCSNLPPSGYYKLCTAAIGLAADTSHLDKVSSSKHRPGSQHSLKEEGRKKKQVKANGKKFLKKT